MRPAFDGYEILFFGVFGESVGLQNMVLLVLILLEVELNDSILLCPVNWVLLLLFPYDFAWGS
jgi:hypothetical protein